MQKQDLKPYLVKEVTSQELIELVSENIKPFYELMAYYRCAMMEVETKFRVLDEHFSLKYNSNPIESIKSRLKAPESIAEKLSRRGFPLTIESIEKNIYDVAGVRVICSFPRDIYMLADLLLMQDDVVLVEKRDYIKNPKPSGYRSLHLIVEVPIYLHSGKKMVKVEVQLRTIAMDFWASIEHKLRYKNNINKKEVKTIAEELLECSRVSAMLDKRMEQIKEKIDKL